jgi:hypothetical protein
MATLIRANGNVEPILPANGTHFNLTELQTLVGGYIEIAECNDGKLIVLDEEGKLKRKPFNLVGTALYKYGGHDPIVGDIVVATLFEINGPPDDEEETPPKADAFLYATPVKGEPFRLYIFDADGMHGGGQWFQRVPQYPDECISVEAAQAAAERAIADGREVRVTDGGDMLVLHVVNGKRLYPAATVNVWESL